MASFDFTGIIDDAVSLLTADAISLFAGLVKAPWGIYYGFVPLIQADTVTSFNFDQEFDISDYPVEQGQFQSYNKVYRPFETTFRFARGGPLALRQEFLDSIQAVINNTLLYNVVTEAATYTNVNLVGCSYSQTPGSGLGLIQVDVKARQVMEIGGLIAGIVSFIENAIDPSDDSQINLGAVQTTLPTTTQAASIPNITSFGF